MKTFGLLLAVAVSLNLFSAVPAAKADEECRPCPFDCEGIGARSKDCRNLPYRRGECCVDLDDRGFEQLERKDHENQYDNQYGNRCGRDRGNYDNRCNGDRGDRGGIVRPSCPPGSTFNGQHCVINDRSRVKPGHKGTINPCPNGMHLAGDRCVY